MTDVTEHIETQPETEKKSRLRLSEDEIQKRYYTISEVARELNVNASALRYWEKEAGVSPSRKDAGGKRKYTPDDMARLRNLQRLLKEDKLSVAEARQKIEDNARKIDAPQAPKDILLKVKFFLENLRDSL